jgi:glycosyltransferase involved in cell wall biosynthesis
MEYDVLFVCGTLDYENSVSGNYILYKCLKKVDNLKIKVLPLFTHTKQEIDSEDFLEFVQPSPENLNYLISIIPKHKVLFLSGNDFPTFLTKIICEKFNSKFVTITMSHWMFGNTSNYPEIEDDMDGTIVSDRRDLWESLDSTIIVGSTNSYNVLKNSELKNIKSELIPFPFEEIDIDTYYKKPESDKKYILWGTTQPQRFRKGKAYFENILEWLYKKVENPNDIIIHQIGPKSDLDTKFKVEYIGYIPTRKELSKVYKNANVFALTTLADAGPMMAVECIKNETPLVSFATNISTDIVKDGKNGYIVDGTEEYADRLYDILYNNDFHIDLDYVKQFNSEDIVMKKYNEFFKNILK